MEKIFVTSFIISVFYCFIKFLELRVLYKKTTKNDDEIQSLKPVFRDSILIFICSFCSMFFIEQISPVFFTLVGDITTGEILDTSSPKVFTNIPDF